ncbi:hypothetical protein D3C75_483120 [compost metagenome]
MPVVDHQHQRPAAAAALLDKSGSVAEQAAPGYGAAGRAVNASDNRPARTKRGQVDADTAAAGHNFGHFGERLHDAAAAVFGRRNHIAVEQSELLACPCTSGNPAARDELPVIENRTELVRPLLLQLRRLLDRGHGCSQPVPHFLRCFFYIKCQLLHIGLHQLTAASSNLHNPAAALDNFTDLLGRKFRVILGQHQYNIAHLGIVCVRILPGITVQKYFLAQSLEALLGSLCTQ